MVAEPDGDYQVAGIAAGVQALHDHGAAGSATFGSTPPAPLRQPGLSEVWWFNRLFATNQSKNENTADGNQNGADHN